MLSKVRGTQWYVVVTIESSVSVPEALLENGFVGSVGRTLLKSILTVLAKPAQFALQPSVRPEVREHRCPECNYRTPKELMQQQRRFCIVD